MEYANFVKPELAVLVPALYGLGAMLKKSEKVKDNHIPLVLTVVSLVLSCLYVIGTEGITTNSVFTAIVQGFICAAATVYGNQVYKQTTKDE